MSEVRTGKRLRLLTLFTIANSFSKLIRFEKYVKGARSLMSGFLSWYIVQKEAKLEPFSYGGLTPSFSWDCAYIIPIFKTSALAASSAVRIPRTKLQNEQPFEAESSSANMSLW